MKINPFLINNYISPEYFCDREKETEETINAINNRRQLMIFSPRRIGKTGLIKNVFHFGRQEKYFLPVYCDIMATGSLKDFTETFARAVLTSLAASESAIKKILKVLASLRPKAGIDPITGEPYISLVISTEKEAIDSLQTVFRYIRNQKNMFAIAIDEFQQIAYYPEKNTEAVLRTFIQETNNLNMIFSGSRKHILMEIFSSPSRPFYSSTQMMEIGKIPAEKYKDFILSNFEKGSIKIGASAIDLILDLTSLHTFYVQYLCNRLFSSGGKINEDAVRKMLLRIITENEAVYAGYITILTPLQFKVLRAIAINNGVKNPTSAEFLGNYNLGAASSVSLTIKSLTDKEFIDFADEKYILNDLFFNAWLRYRADVF
jgi:AAA+ ATPase superfamily predicted ATPase